MPSGQNSNQNSMALVNASGNLDSSREITVQNVQTVVESEFRNQDNSSMYGSLVIKPAVL